MTNLDQIVLESVFFVANKLCEDLRFFYKFMHKIQEVITRLFESRLASHITFLTGIFLFFLVMVALADHPSKLVFNAVVIGIFDTLCVYAGRWCARRLLADNQFLPFLLR